MKKICFILFATIALTSQAQQLTPSDVAVFNAIQKQNFSKLTDFGTYFLGKPYVANTLDVAANEQLVVNLRQFDCTTFVETVLALYLSKNHGIDDFCKTLQLIRYRNGKIDDYTSRLHYFTDWVSNNESLGLVTDVTESLGACLPMDSINFMSTHVSSYAQLAADTVLQQKIVLIEQKLNSIPHFYLPKSSVKTASAKLRDGDIICLVTNVKGLDVMHVGFAKRAADGSVHLLHASRTHKQVFYSPEPLDVYLQKSKRCIGIIVVRANE